MENRYGYGYGDKYRKTPDAFSKKKGRADDHIEKDEYKQCYSNTSITRWPDGRYEMHCWEEGKEFYESAFPGGSSTKHLPDGSVDTTITGRSRTHSKWGEIKTVEDNSDGMTKGHVRRERDGGYSTTTKGNKASYCQGCITEAGAQNSDGYYIGKKVTNAEGGIGFGVNKGSSMKLFQRMEPDGTFHLQVTPAGDEGGAAVVKITPDGNITITSQKAISMESTEGINLKTKTLTIEADIKMKGNFNQEGRHRDSLGLHK